jgi:hypothetical protein
MGTPINPNAGANPYGVGGNNVGSGLLSSYGIGVQGGAVTSSTSFGTSASGDTVYLGTRPRASAKELKLAGVSGTAEAGESVLMYNDAIGLPLTWSRNDPNKLKEFVNKGILLKVPGFTPDMGMPEIMDAWKSAVDASIEFSKNSPTRWTPWDVIDSYGNSKGSMGTTVENGWVIDIATGKRIGYKGELTKKTKRTEVNLTSPEEVHAIMNQALADALGRAPSDKELATFRASVATMEAQRPQVSEVTTQLKPNLETGQLEEVSTSAVSSGGVSSGDIQQAAMEAAQRTPEYGKYQSGTTYFDAMMQMITGG